MAAAQFAPIAANVAEDVGSGALQVAAGVGAATHHGNRAHKEEEDPRKSAMDSDDSCNQLEVEVPGVIELRRNAAGTPEYRELQLSDSLDQRQWAPIADRKRRLTDGGRRSTSFRWISRRRSAPWSPKAPAASWRTRPRNLSHRPTAIGWLR